MKKNKDDALAIICVLSGLLIAMTLIYFDKANEVEELIHIKMEQRILQKSFNDKVMEVVELEATATKLNTRIVNLESTIARKDEQNVELQEWATNVYCSTTVGNAHIKYTKSGNSAFRSIWQLYIQGEELTSPPINIIDCRGE